MPPTAVRINRKDLRGPDEFVTISASVLRYAQAHAKLLSWVGAIAVALVVVVAAVFSYRASEAERARIAFAKALDAYTAGRYSEAAGQLQEVRRRWGTAGGLPVGVYLGEAQLALGNFQEAKDTLSEALPSISDSYVRQQALVALGYALENTKDYAAAAQRFGEAAAIQGPFSAQAVLGQGRNSELAGNLDAAKDAYAKFLQDFPQAPERPAIEAHSLTLQ